jgi:16S rRNA (adenine1518-N6/adenine1519-N6)-dimethyltransferase
VRPKDLLRKYGLHAKKSWGQNFLVDDKAYEAIVEACRLTRDDWVIEIGAGLGTLTARLQPLARRVIAVERDRDMVTVLRGELSGNVEIAEANALSYDYGAIEMRAERKPIVVGNLPYQIASPILFRLLEARRHLLRIVVMLQREMADRILAPPSTPEYGALGVMVRMFGEAKLVRKVPAGAFLPAPRVDSAVLAIEPFASTRIPVRDVERFGEVVHAAFQQRRKTLRNALAKILGPEAFVRAQIDPARRGETLSVEEFARLSDA